MVILKRILKEVVLLLDLILYYNTGHSGIFGKDNGFVLAKTMSSKVLQMDRSKYGFISTICLGWLVHIFLNY
jgi:hypothetical protein